MRKAVQVAQRAVVPVEELLVAVPVRLVEECLARADQCQDPAKGHPCRDNPLLGKEASPDNQVARHPAKACLERKAHQEIQPEHKGPVRLEGSHLGRALVPYQGQALQGRHPDQVVTDQ
ncbi:hypothetical protein [Nitrosovibrio tenuis]|uniref:Uncharacterized protein n=1 Tax=Nitrosovibrio tenuis TaxID=1233 RepID=A0A1H7R1I3_9PROT|nr:hypothetical protein [Nitrosovibrio tenuis]SEL54110.1 hypothetical protein SAMN05216387_11448 [Nitrosovibrio tenuis]